MTKAADSFNFSAREPFPLSYGSYEDAQALLNKPGGGIVAEFSVTWEMIKLYCSLVEDGNASHWDSAYAKQQWGGIIAPPGMLLTWCMPLQWHPEKKPEHFMMAVKVPLPGKTLINVATSAEFHRHLFVGDTVTAQDKLTALSAKKETRLGVGHFITTEAEFRNQKGELVAVQTNNLFRYDSQ